jgi:hypothetical protein
MIGFNGDFVRALKLLQYARLTKQVYLTEYFAIAEVAELADALRSGRSGHYAHVGSSPTFGTKPCFYRVFLWVLKKPTICGKMKR